MKLNYKRTVFVGFAFFLISAFWQAYDTIVHARQAGNAHTKTGGNAGYEKFRADLSAETLGTVYIFHGEESYLREYYLGELRKQLVPAGFEEFNYHRLEGKDLSVQTLSEMAEAPSSLLESSAASEGSSNSGPG